MDGQTISKWWPTISQPGIRFVRLKRIFQADAISPHGFSLINWRATNRQIRLTRQKVSSNRFGLGGPIDTNVSQRTNAGLVLERALSSNTHLQRCISIRVYPYAHPHPQHLKVLKHFVYIQYGCGMQSMGVCSLNHDTATSYRLGHTPFSLKSTPTSTCNTA